MDATSYDPLKGKQVKPSMDLSKYAKPRPSFDDVDADQPLDDRNRDSEDQPTASPVWHQVRTAKPAW